MKVQVLVVTMNQCKEDYSLLEKMNIQTDAIVCNQCDRNEVNRFIFNNHNILWYSFNEIGVGLNRNNGLMRSDADICILADDDMVFKEGYEDKIIQWYEKYPKTDLIMFNLMKDNETSLHNKRVKKINKFNYGKYGAARITFRNKPIQLFGIHFSTMFGGGCQFSCGEDTLFIAECLNKGLSLIEVPDSLARITDDRQSTWFKGYNDKYFFDKGVLYYLLNRYLCLLLILFHSIKHYHLYKEYGIMKAIVQMYKGTRYSKKKGY